MLAAPSPRPAHEESPDSANRRVLAVAEADFGTLDEAFSSPPPKARSVAGRRDVAAAPVEPVQHFPSPAAAGAGGDDYDDFSDGFDEFDDAEDECIVLS